MNGVSAIRRQVVIRIPTALSRIVVVGSIRSTQPIAETSRCPSNEPRSSSSSVLAAVFLLRVTVVIIVDTDLVDVFHGRGETFVRVALFCRHGLFGGAGFGILALARRRTEDQS